MNATAEYAGFHEFGGDNGETYGSFEVFHVREGELMDDSRAYAPAGWYWWACFPGCLPDGEPAGPFETSEGAYRDALEG